MAEDPLADLLLDADDVDRAQLAQGLKGILGVDNNSGRVVLKPGFNDLDTRKKVLAFLLGAKAAFLLGKAETEVVAPKDITKQTGLPTGTVNPKLKELREQRLVSRTDVGGYHVAPHQVTRGLEVVRGGVNHDSG